MNLKSGEIYFIKKVFNNEFKRVLSFFEKEEDFQKTVAIFSDNFHDFFIKSMVEVLKDNPRLFLKFDKETQYKTYDLFFINDFSLLVDDDIFLIIKQIILDNPSLINKISFYSNNRNEKNIYHLKKFFLKESNKDVLQCFLKSFKYKLQDNREKITHVNCSSIISFFSDVISINLKDEFKNFENSLVGLWIVEVEKLKIDFYQKLTDRIILWFELEFNDKKLITKNIKI